MSIASDIDIGYSSPGFSGPAECSPQSWFVDEEPCHGGLEQRNHVCLPSCELLYHRLTVGCVAMVTADPIHHVTSHHPY